MSAFADGWVDAGSTTVIKKGKNVMNTDTFAGVTKDGAGSAERRIGGALGDDSMREQGLADQIAGKGQAMFGDAKDAVAPAIDKARTVARKQPWAAALAAGVVGLAVIGSLKGRNRV